MAKTKQALDAEDWSAVERLWQPWIAEGDPEAEFQLGYHYLSFTPCNDDATTERMNELIQQAASKDHPDALWLTATRLTDWETSPAFERLLLRAGQLGSVNAQRSLGVAYATGDWIGPRNLVEAARWYRMAAEKGHAASQYDLGFMILLGEGEPKSIDEGLKWLKRAGEQGEPSAVRLLVDCFENGFCDVPSNSAEAAVWRDRLEEHSRLNPPRPALRYLVVGPEGKASLDILCDVDGVSGFSSMTCGSELTEVNVFYDPAVVQPNAVDERIHAAGISAVRQPD